MSFLRRHWKISSGLLVATIATATAWHAYEARADSCCLLGSSCCHAGSPCCAHHHRGGT
jgi:hypothetical protein